MPEKTLHVALGLVAALAVAGIGYLAGFKSVPAGGGVEGGSTAGSVAEVAGASEPAAVASTRVEDSPILANGVGSIDGDAGPADARRAFLAASEKRSGGYAPPAGKGADQGAFEEDSRMSDGDIAELAGRLEALEQAFALDSKRSRNRGGGGGGEDIDELKETVSNLYDIVGGLPSLDTLETKVAAVDGAIEEMNATMERLVELGSRMEALEKGGDAEAAKALEAVQKVQEELSNLARASKETMDSVNAMRGEVSNNSESAAGNAEMAARVGKQVADAEEAIGAVKAAVDGIVKEAGSDRRRLDSLSSQLSVMDKNLRSAVEGYKKVYENAARSEKRFLSIEAFLGDIETRMGAIEANFGPAQ